MYTPSLSTTPRTQQSVSAPVEYWVFDLDNTLYSATSSLPQQIGERICQFVANALRLPSDKAFALQKHYYHEYGTTLRGLMQCHGINPREFLAYIHDIDCGELKPSPRLTASLAALPGRRLIFTNSSEHHARNVLEHLGILSLFDGIFDIQMADYIPKPNAESYALMTKRFGINPRLTAMFEDTPRNLLPAAAIGMTTVWLREDGHHHWTKEHDGEALPHIHHITHNLAAWLENWSKARS